MTVIGDGTPLPDGDHRPRQEGDKDNAGVASSFSTKDPMGISEEDIRVSYVTEPCYGDVKIWLNGCCVSGPEWKQGYGSFIAILAPSVLLDVFVAPDFNVGVMVVLVILEVITLYLLFKTIYSDPGILPRLESHGAYEDPATGEKRFRAPPRFQDCVLSNHPFRLKYCHTCHLYRPPRATHCGTCDTCVTRFDHHCPWVGTCIGGGNYRIFYSFITCTAALTLFGLGLSVAHLVILSDDNGGFVGGVEASPMTVVVLVYCALFMWFTVGLFLYHTYLVLTAQTTYEQIKGVYSLSHGCIDNPYYRGPGGNMKYGVAKARRKGSKFDRKRGTVVLPSSLPPVILPCIHGGSEADPQDDIHGALAADTPPTTDACVTTPEVPHGLEAQHSPHSTPAADRTTASSRAATEYEDRETPEKDRLAEAGRVTQVSHGPLASMEDPSPVIEVPNAIVKLAGVDLNKTAL